jgi:hypothetical protein
MPQIQDAFNEVFKESDSEGNIYSFMYNPVHHLYMINLKLQFENRWRHIADIDESRGIMKMKRNRARHYFDSHKGYGFNWHLINWNRLFPIRSILLIEQDGDQVDGYSIPIEKIKETGRKLKHVRAGQELQWFVPFVEIIKYRLKRKTMVSQVLIKTD